MTKIAFGMPALTADLMSALNELPHDGEVFVELDAEAFKLVIGDGHGAYLYPVGVDLDEEGDIIITVSAADSVLSEVEQ